MLSSEKSPPPYETVDFQPRISRRRFRKLAAMAAIIWAITTLWNLDLHTGSQNQHKTFHEEVKKCYQSRITSQGKGISHQRRENLRWHAENGQKAPIVLRNATLFDGESTSRSNVDILFEKGIITSVTPTSANKEYAENVEILEVRGNFVTPGLVDMHSHHFLIPYPQLSSTRDVNEKNLGPITPFVRAIDGMKPYDPAIKIIASGGVTSSLILPGSSNIIGGEAYMVKNDPYPGINAEPVVDELLLDYGIREELRQRYLKMACGENPKGQYDHTRMGLVWLLRQHLEKTKKLKERQDAWCSGALEIQESGLLKKSKLAKYLNNAGTRPEELELDTTVALLTGELNVNIHCYEPEDLERMLSVLHEFGVHPHAFHHALDAWKVPQLLKKLEENITIATFAENGFFKSEAYGANLRGPAILNNYGIPVALKSDHTGESNNAKHLIYQAAISHSFGLPGDRALQAVTSVPARSVQQDHRIGYARAGYDADLVIWNPHPLQFDAVPIQVFIDGKALLEKDTVSSNDAPPRLSAVGAPRPRRNVRGEQRGEVCGQLHSESPTTLFTNVWKVLLDLDSSPKYNTEGNVSLLIENGRITCIDHASQCLTSAKIVGDITSIDTNGGYITPGLIAFGNSVGIQEISAEESTGDGIPSKSANPLDEEKSLHLAKYGVHFTGRVFTRARVGGITKAFTPPRFGGGILQGVSVGLRTSENASALGDGIWKDEIAIHFVIGQAAKSVEATSTTSAGIERLRQILTDETPSWRKHHGLYAQAANGSLPVVVHAINEDDISQLILLKRDLPLINLIIYGGHAAPLVAKDLAAAKIPVILTGNRGTPDSWAKQHALSGPPLTPSPAQVLLDAGVLLGLAVQGDSKLHGLALEAQWARRFAGLSEEAAIELVSTNIEKILGLDKKNSDKNSMSDGRLYDGDFVVWDGNPLKGEGSVIAAIQDDGKVGYCWPDVEGIAI